MDKKKKGSFRNRSSIKKANEQAKNMVRNADGDTIIENAFEFIDPTGITSWDDVYRSLNDGKKGTTPIEVLGAMPLVGKATKLVKGTNKLAPHAKLMLNTPLMVRAIDGIEDAKNLTTKFAFGGKTNSDPMQNYVAQRYAQMSNNPAFIEDPNSTLADNNIRKAKAMQDAQSNPWTQGLDILGSLAMQTGMSMMGSGMTGTTPSGDAAATNGMGGWLNNLGGMDQDPYGWNNTTFVPGATVTKMALGGKTGMNPVEVEGQEVGQLPNGQLLDFKGPSHEAGGINTMLPDATTIFSKRIKIDGKTMADRKKLREKQTGKLEKLQKDNGTDILLKNAMERTKVTTEAEDAFDLQLQEQIASLYGQNQETAAYGSSGTGNPWQQMLQQMFQTFGQGQQGVVPNMTGTSADYHTPVTGAVDYANPFGNETMQELVINVDRKQPETSTALPVASNTDTPGEGFSLNQAGLPTFGDALGIYGNLKQAYDPMNLTLENRAGDTPNINAFKDFGKDGLNVLDDAKKYVSQVRDENLAGMNLARTGAVNRNRNTARGINTQRALDLATDSQVNKSMNDIYSNFASQMMGILSQEAGMENQQDSMVMQGEQARDLADRQDRDMFYTNLSRDKQAVGEALTRTGKATNEIKGRGVNQTFLNQMSDYVKVNVMNGSISAKEGVKLIGDKNEKLSTFESVKGWESIGMTKADWDKLTKQQKLRKLI